MFQVEVVVSGVMGWCSFRLFGCGKEIFVATSIRPGRMPAAAEASLMLGNRLSMSDFAQSVKQQADIVKVIESYIRLRKAGAQRFSGLCPFHKEKTPSFSVHAIRQFYHCFGCQASGDVFSFVGKIENVSFPEAVRILAQKSGI